MHFEICGPSNGRRRKIKKREDSVKIRKKKKEEDSVKILVNFMLLYVRDFV